jgi:hypothetical protein
MPRQRRFRIAVGLLAGVAGLAALAGALYGLFGPLVAVSGGTPRERTESHFEYGLSTQAWVLFIGYFLGALATAMAGGMLIWGVLRSAATTLLLLGAVGLGVLAGFTVLGVGWLVLPGALLACLAMLLRLLADGDG